MPSRNWLSHPFLGIGLTVVLIVGGAVLYDQYVNPKCGNDRSAKECQQARGEIPIKPTPKTPDPKPDPERSEWRSERDLEAQWDMADAAKKAWIVALLGVVVTGIGVIYVARTLSLTRRSVEAAINAADAANRTVAVMERTAERQLRAYVCVEKMHLEDLEVGKIVRAEVAIRNTGQTPAYEITNLYSLVIRSFPDHGLLQGPLKRPGRVSRSMMGTDNTRTLYPRSPGLLTQEELDSIKSGASGIYVIGTINYRDVFGKTWHTNFRALHGGDRGTEPGHLYATEDGNDAG